ncbi:DUF2892 domain-containing protein [Paenibacillus sp. NPDC056579]|uniref:YgaP family membrane protein n=1 Tax=unclassified Paenibacillus TaxID=185978 RepID=UPI001EF9136A|nr:DUF2892 domain-containing protein [Paenibacillus sp. H1-7]ULL19317.1 DUF2892 domain-containing protein [Paenibacillus sp. H1-7]
MKRNVGGADRAIRIITGLAFASLVYFLPGAWKWLGIISVPLLFTGLTQKCAINRLLGINSCKL